MNPVANERFSQKTIAKKINPVLCSGTFYLRHTADGIRDEIVKLAKNIEEAGASIINTGIGWHEARIPTIATSVPRAGFSWVTKKLKGQVRV